MLLFSFIKVIVPQSKARILRRLEEMSLNMHVSQVNVDKQYFESFQACHYNIKILVLELRTVDVYSNRLRTTVYGEGP